MLYLDKRSDRAELQISFFPMTSYRTSIQLEIYSSTIQWHNVINNTLHPRFVHSIKSSNCPYELRQKVFAITHPLELISRPIKLRALRNRLRHHRAPIIIEHDDKSLTDPPRSIEFGQWHCRSEHGNNRNLPTGARRRRNRWRPFITCRGHCLSHCALCGPISRSATLHTRCFAPVSSLTSNALLIT